MFSLLLLVSGFQILDFQQSEKSVIGQTLHCFKYAADTLVWTVVREQRLVLQTSMQSGMCSQPALNYRTQLSALTN